jgi:hypothetical protein
MNDAVDRAKVASAHFLRARVSTSEPALKELITGFAALVNAVEALAVQLADTNQRFLFISEKSV